MQQVSTRFITHLQDGIYCLFTTTIPIIQCFLSVANFKGDRTEPIDINGGGTTTDQKLTRNYIAKNETAILINTGVSGKYYRFLKSFLCTISQART